MRRHEVVNQTEQRQDQSQDKPEEIKEEFQESLRQARADRNYRVMVELLYAEASRQFEAECSVENRPSHLLKIARLLNLALKIAEKNRIEEIQEEIRVKIVEVEEEYINRCCGDEVDPEKKNAYLDRGYELATEKEISETREDRGKLVSETSDPSVTTIKDFYEAEIGPAPIPEDKWEIVRSGSGAPESSTLPSDIEFMLLLSADLELSEAELKVVQEYFVRLCHLLNSKERETSGITSTYLNESLDLSEAVIGEPPSGLEDKWAILRIGTGATESATLHSGIEFVVVLSDDLSEAELTTAQEYFKKLIHLLNFKVMRKKEEEIIESEVEEGLDEDYKLVNTVDGLIGCLESRIIQRDSEINILPAMLSNSSYLRGSMAIYESYKDSARAKLQVGIVPDVRNEEVDTGRGGWSR